MNTAIILEQAGVKSTTLRVLVYDALFKMKAPIDIPTLVDMFRKRSHSIDRATVFRIMNVFTKAGLTKRIEFSEGKFRYELSDRPHHHHLICKQCDSIEDVEVKQDLSTEEKRIAREMKFLVSEHALEFYGLCRNCS